MATKKKEPTILEVLRDKARTYFLANRSMNAFKRTSDVARKALLKGMLDEGIEEFDFATKDEEGKALQLEVSIAAAEKTKMDVAKLRDLVDDEVFMQIVTASKKDIEALAGKEAAVMCELKVPGEDNAQVKAAE